MEKTCTKCSEKFSISEDFFEKIKVSTPTLCPDCRNQRRQVFRNDRVFYNRKCDLSGKQFVSMYSPESPYKVFFPDEWYGDKWDPMDYGRDFDFDKPFFEQFQALMVEVPRLGIDIVNCENSYYCNYCGDDKNCYLDIAGEANEDCYFNLFVKYSKNVVDSTFAYNCELCYECINCYDCYNVQNSIYLENCSDCFYSFDLKGCRNCLFSTGLRNKEYYIFNKLYSKEEYAKYLKDLKLSSFSQREKLASGWKDFLQKKGVFKPYYHLNCENSSGDNLKNCKNVEFSFNATNCEDCAYLYDVLDATDCQDLNYSLYKPELSYELISTLNMVKCAFSMASHYNSEIYYCDLTNNCKNLFGCIGLKQKQYCVLNKQYSREEYEELVPKIVEHMTKTGEWGEFFPPELSPFAYNETVAQEYYPLNQETAFRWKEDKSEHSYKGPDVEIPDDINDVEDLICKNILKCEKSGKLYKIIPEELNFYRKMQIPVPRRSADQRHKDRINLRNPRHLYQQKCSKCQKEIFSTYSPERMEMVYCESCYIAQVY